MKTIEEIEQYAKDNFIPIARKDVVFFLNDLIARHNYTRVLEIGTAIGYTSLNLALLKPNLQITTLEIDESNFLIARQNFIDFKVDKQIFLLNTDARFFYPDLYYDLIFIDAAKQKNIFFFEKFSKYLNHEGIIVIDNLNLNDLLGIANDKKIQKFSKMKNELISYFDNLQDFEVNYHFNIGDGMIITKKQKIR